MNSLKNKKNFNINEIIEILPHRYPFILIDKIQINEPGISLTAMKNTTINEPYFQGHFPGQPIMPGVLSLEMMAQAGSFLMLNQVDDPLTKNMFFTTVEKAKFKKPIIPGDQLTVNVDLIKKEILALKEQGATIIFSTHRMESVEELCDHIALINQGKCILQGSVDEVKSAYRSHTYQLQFEGELKAVNNFEIISQKENSAVFKALKGKESNHLLQQLLPQVKVISFQEQLPSINDIFIQKVSE